MFFWFLLFIFLCFAIASVPAYPYSRRWGYYPSSGFGFLFVLLLVLWYFSWLPVWLPAGAWR